MTRVLSRPDASGTPSLTPIPADTATRPAPAETQWSEPIPAAAVQPIRGEEIVTVVARPPAVTENAAPLPPRDAAEAVIDVLAPTATERTTGASARRWTFPMLRRGQRIRPTAEIGIVEAETIVAPDEVSPAAPPERRRGRKARPERIRRSWREQRWERRRRRRAAEEVLGWVLVPLILVIGYWGVSAALSAVGTTPTALIQGIKAAVSGRI